MLLLVGKTLEQGISSPSAQHYPLAVSLVLLLYSDFSFSLVSETTLYSALFKNIEIKKFCTTLTWTVLFLNYAAEHVLGCAVQCTSLHELQLYIPPNIQTRILVITAHNVFSPMC